MENARLNAVNEILSYQCPRYSQLPDIPLYIEQVVELLTRYTAPLLLTDGEPPITPAMINNYVKQHIIPSPVKKRYGREHIARLYCICLLKQMFTVSEIRQLLSIRTTAVDVPFQEVYDYFCVELEKALQATFSTRDFSAPSSAPRMTPESELVRSAALTIANKLFTTKFLQLYVQLSGKLGKPASTD